MENEENESIGMILGDHFVCSCIFIFRNENWMNKSARVSEKLVCRGLPGLQVAKCLTLEMSVCDFPAAMIKFFKLNLILSVPDCIVKFFQFEPILFIEQV